ncbi:MAG TPA: Gfo/Idh/MocA family oxidoreductase, partial [Naasia sp.]
WRGNPALTGGGLLFSSGSHTIDVLSSVFGPVSAVTAVNRQLVADDPGKADDNATVVLEHSGGAMSTFTGCWTARQDSSTVIDAISPDETLRAVTDGDDLVLLSITTTRTEELLRTRHWFEDSNRRALEALTDYIGGGAAPPYSLDDILTSMTVLQAAYRSSDEQRRVTIAS